MIGVLAVFGLFPALLARLVFERIRHRGVAAALAAGALGAVLIGVVALPETGWWPLVFYGGGLGLGVSAGFIALFGGRNALDERPLRPVVHMMVTACLTLLLSHVIVAR
ncbi:MAG: hypothetical protein AAF914_10475 [Pseudomonadota bacterium]